MGNNVKGYKDNLSKRYSGTERSATEFNNSMDSNNFNFSSDHRKNLSFYSNNEYVDVDRELNNEEISRSFKNEGFSVKNNLEEIRRRNFKSIEYSDSRKKRLESIKELEKRLDDMNAHNQNNLNNSANLDFTSKINNIRSNIPVSNGELNHNNDFQVRRTTTFLKNPANNLNNEINDNAQLNSRFDRRLTVNSHRNANNFNNLNDNQNKIGLVDNYSKNQQMNLKDNYTDAFIDFNSLSNNNTQANTKELSLENNRYNENRMNNSGSNFMSVGLKENLNIKNLNNQNNVLDLKSLIQQSVDNVNDMNRRFTLINNMNPADNADSFNNRRTNQNSEYNSNTIQIPGHHRFHSHSVNPKNKISNSNVNLNQNLNLNFGVNNNNYLNLRTIEKDDSIINSLNTSNVNSNFYNELSNINNSIISNKDYKIKINSANQLNSEGTSNKNSFNKNNFTDKNSRNDYNTISNNLQSNKNSSNNNLIDSFNLNNFKNEEININNNYTSANNSMLTDYFDNNNNNNNNNYNNFNNESVKTSNQSLGRRNIFEEELNKRENATTLSLTQKIKKITAERELSQDSRTPEPRKLNPLCNNINNKTQSPINSLKGDLINFSSEKDNFINENNCNNNNIAQAIYNSNSRTNADNTKFINDSKNFEIIYEKEEEGISKNPSALYDIANQASHEDIRKSVSKFPDNNNNNNLITAANNNASKLLNGPISNEVLSKNIKSVGSALGKNIDLDINAININNKILEDKKTNIRNRLSINTTYTNQNIKNEPNQILKNPNTTQASNTNSQNINKHYSTEVTDTNLNYVLTLNDNINNSKEYSPKSITSNSNYFLEKTQNNLNTSENDLALQSHRITESIKNIMNSNNILIHPDLGNYYNTISFINTDEDANGTLNKSNNNAILPLKSAKNSDNQLNKNLLGCDNKRISFKNTEEIPIVTGEILGSLKNQGNTSSNLNSNGKNSSLLNSNNKANKNFLLDKKNQFSQKSIGNKTDLSNVTNKKFSLKEKTLVKNTKLTNSLSSINSIRKENKLGVNIAKANIKPKTTGNNGYHNTEPAKPTKKEEPVKNLPISSRNKNTSKLGLGSFNNTTMLSESNENVKKNLTNKFNTDSLKKNVSRRNLSVSTNPIKKPSFSSSVNSKSLHNSFGSSFLGNRKGNANEANKCTCKCKCLKCKKAIDFIAEEPELEGKMTIGVNNPSSGSEPNLFGNLKIFETLQAKNFLEFLFIVSDLSLTSLNANNSTKNIIQNFKNTSIFSSKQIFNDLLRVLKSLMDNSLNFNIEEETCNRNNLSNFSANSSFFNLSFEKRRSELNRRRDERKNAKIIFIQKKWREYKLRKILKNNNIDFFTNSKADISSKCKNYILESFMKNTKMLMILEHFNKSMVLWNELFNCPKNSNIKNSLIQVKQIEMDNLINFDSNSLLHSIASKAITTHVTEKEIIKENEEKLAAKPKTSGSSVKENLFSKVDKKNASFTSRNLKTSKITSSLVGKK